MHIAGGSRQWRVDDRWRGDASGSSSGGGGGGSSCAARSKRRVQHSRQIGEGELRGIERRSVSSEGWMAAASVGVLEVVAIAVCVV